MTKTLSLYEGDAGGSATTDFLRKTVWTDCLRMVKGPSLGRGLVANWVLAGQEQLKQREKEERKGETGPYWHCNHRQQSSKINSLIFDAERGITIIENRPILPLLDINL